MPPRCPCIYWVIIICPPACCDDNGDYPDNACALLLLPRSPRSSRAPDAFTQILHCHDGRTELIPAICGSFLGLSPTIHPSLSTPANLAYPGSSPWDSADRSAPALFQSAGSSSRSDDLMKVGACMPSLTRWSPGFAEKSARRSWGMVLMVLRAGGGNH